MDITVPQENPVLSEEEERNLSNKPIYAHNERRDIEDVAKEYFEAKHVIPILNMLLCEVYLTMPSDPIDHIMEYLIRRRTTGDPIHEHSAEEVQKIADEAVAYSNKFKFPHLFDELLTAMLDDTPEDPERFILSWLRWHKNGFIQRQLPEGYRAYHEQKNSDEKRNSDATPK